MKRKLVCAWLLSLPSFFLSSPSLADNLCSEKRQSEVSENAKLLEDYLNKKYPDTFLITARECNLHIEGVVEPVMNGTTFFAPARDDAEVNCQKFMNAGLIK